MNSPRGVFLLFVVALLTLGFLAFWWLGPGLVSIAWDGDQRRSPYLVLALDTGPPPAASEVRPFGVAAIDLPEDARLRWRAAELRVAFGTSVPEWSRIELWSFASGASFVRLATSAPFRAAQDDAPARELYGFPAAALPAAAATYPVLFAAALNEAVGEEPPVTLEVGLGSVLPDGARVSWVAQPVSLRGEDRYDEFLLLSFSTAEARQQWLWADPTQLELELLRLRFNRLQCWELGALER